MALVEEVGKPDKLPPEANSSSPDTVTLGTPPLAPHWPRHGELPAETDWVWNSSHARV